MGLFGGRDRSDSAHHSPHPYADQKTLTTGQVHRATRARLIWASLSSVLLLLTVIFLIVAEVGDTSRSNGSTGIYFISVRGHPYSILFPDRTEFGLQTARVCHAGPSHLEGLFELSNTELENRLQSGQLAGIGTSAPCSFCFHCVPWQ